MTTTFEPVGTLRMDQGPNPIGTLYIPINMMIDGDKIMAYTKQTDENGNESYQISQIGTMKLTSSQKSYNLNVFGSTVIINKIAIEELKRKTPGGIKSVTAVVPVENNNMPTGVKSAILANSTAY